MTGRVRFAWQNPRRQEVIGQWRLLRVLGEGGNARVWRARNASGDEVALKTLLREKVNSERYDRFAQEVRVHLTSLTGVPGVLPLLDAVVPTDDPITDVPWLAMPIATPLQQHLGDVPMTAKTVQIVADLAGTLVALLQKFGISHRDIKPENLYWWEGGAAIGDFGLVSIPDSATITRDSRDLGPRSFLAPEMRAGQPNREGPPADVFALALTAFTLLGGDPPRDGLRREVAQHNLASMYDDPHLESLDRILQRATSYDADVRPAMGQFAADLEAWLSPYGFDDELDLSHIQRRIANLAVRQTTGRRPSPQDTDHLFRRLASVTEPVHDLLNNLDLDAGPDAGDLRIYEWINDRRISKHNRSQRISTYSPEGADGAVWLACGFAHKLTDDGLSYVLAVWALGAHDSPPQIVWSETLLLDSASEAAIREGEGLMHRWRKQARRSIERAVDTFENFNESARGQVVQVDNEAPTLRDFRLDTTSFVDSGRVEVVAKAHIIDRGSGAAVSGPGSPSQARLRGPSQVVRDFLFAADRHRMCGTRNDGFYENAIYLEEYDARGQWEVEYVSLVDLAGHIRTVSPDDLKARGFDTNVEIV